MSSNNKPVAIVTGASSGIGRATAIALKGAGYRVYGTSRRQIPASPDGITMLACDVADNASVDTLVAHVLAEAGRIDVLVNNAGLGMTAGAEEVSVERAKTLFEVNVFGVLRMTNAVLPTMRRQKSGRIINISSVLGFIPAPHMAHYAATKHALEGYSESLDHEIRTFGVRVSLIEPAYTRTSFDANAIQPDRLIAAYEPGRASADAVMQTAMTTGDAPEVVAGAVLEAVGAKHPKLRYAAGKLARQISFLRRFVPATAFDKSLRKQNGLPA
ncbi:oxidoreductase [Bosea sp. (in: a-proteobacteria)]|uniref:oxidoreductase n=1 Tax=Bosea sp. (in: a-proteobacteria) TaxID=1871050 RepID=UPI002B4984DF|nr:oxidoreductase [Bosea sp. (in: a-proteobacteria)]WRH57920.1 MAG: oxidoreductase [Bosea sp. (in: a-proteobacteria)]